MKEDKKIQLNYLKYQIFILLKIMRLKKKNLAIVASGRVGHNHIDFSKKINKKYLMKI